MSIDIRIARTAAEIEAAQRQRYDIFVRDMGYAAPAEHHQLARTVDLLDASGDILVAYDGHSLAGSVLINHGDLGAYASLACLRKFGPYFPDRLMLITKLVIAPAYRSSSLMTRFALALYAHCRDQHPRTMFGVIACVENHAAYYERLGYRHLGECFHHAAAGRVAMMAVALYDLQHFQRVSPAVARLCPRHDTESSAWFARTFEPATQALAT